LKYILAKITQFVEDQAFGNAKPLDWYLDKSVTIEHILPQSQKDIYSERLGNLTLLEKTINSSISDKYYQEKLSGYRESQIIITRSLAEIPYVGNNTQLNRAMNDLNLVKFTTWDHSSIEKRQQILVNIAIKVWGMELENFKV
jgi:hypothetical protein